MKIRTSIVVLLPLTSCIETGQDQTNIPLFVAGRDISEPIVVEGDVELWLDRAELAFGPLYLCAGTTAGDLCDTARLEWLDAVVVDTMEVEPIRAGDLIGTTGPVASWMYDLGISSQLTQPDPVVLRAAASLDDASFVVEGRALIGDIELPFSASIPIQQTDNTELGIPVVRKSVSETFFRDVASDEPGLVVRFDPAAWVSGIDLTPYVTREQCSPAGAAIVCDSRIERVCNNDGTELSSVDCGAVGQVCLPDRGCAERLDIGEDTEAFRSIRNALLSGERPSFAWMSAP